MTDLSKYRGFIEQYMVELKELTFNSKPIINNLTMLAEEHRNIAPSIAAAIERHLSSCPPTSKLPVLYLLDSIAKNVREPFVSAFARNIPEVFSQVWTALPQAHPQLLKLLNTWNGLFPGGTLAALRRAVGQPEVGPRPLSAPGPGYVARPAPAPTSQQGPPASQHLQTLPHHLQGNMHAVHHSSAPHSPAPPMHSVPNGHMHYAQPRHHQAAYPAVGPGYVHAQQQHMQPAAHAIPCQALSSLGQVLQSLQPQPPLLQQYGQQPVSTVGYAAQPSLPFLGLPGSAAPAQSAAPPSETNNALAALLQSLAQGGMLTLPAASAAGPSTQQPAVQASLAPSVPPTAPLQSSALSDSIPTSGALTPEQCKSVMQADSGPAVAKLVESSTALRAKHLDQWYLKRRRLKGSAAANQSQHWFVDENTWLMGTTTDAKAAPDFFEEDQEEEGESSEPVDDSQPNCGLSGEKFDIFWDDEREEWRYRDARRLAGPDAVKYGIAEGTLVKVGALRGAGPASIPATPVQDGTGMAEAEAVAASIAQAAVASAIEHSERDYADVEIDPVPTASASGQEQDVKPDIREANGADDQDRTEVNAGLREVSPALKRQQSDESSDPSKKQRLD